MKNRGFEVNPELYENGTELIKHMLNYATNDKRFLTEELIKKAVGKMNSYNKYIPNSLYLHILLKILIFQKVNKSILLLLQKTNVNKSTKSIKAQDISVDDRI